MALCFGVSWPTQSPPLHLGDPLLVKLVFVFKGYK